MKIADGFFFVFLFLQYYRYQHSACFEIFNFIYKMGDLEFGSSNTQLFFTIFFKILQSFIKID